MTSHDIKQLEKLINARFNGVDERFEEVNRRFDSVDDTLRQREKRAIEQDRRIERNSNNIGQMTGQGEGKRNAILIILWLLTIGNIVYNIIQ